MANIELNSPKTESSTEEETGVYRLSGIDNQKKLFQELAESLSSRSGVAFHQILDGINAREKMGPTYIGKGIAIPHCKLDIDHPVLSIIVLERPIKYSDNTDNQVDIVFGILVPAEQCDQHIHILSSIAKLCDQESWLQHLRGLETNAELTNYIRETNRLLSDLL